MKLSVDEAIQFCKEKSKNIKLKAEPQVFVEIAEKLEELKTYKDLEEQGLLIKLPCPLGTKIYCIHNGFIKEGMICEMSCFKFKDYYKKSWFLTKKEALQALEKGD